MDPIRGTPPRSLDERVEDLLGRMTPRREELPAGHALRLRPCAARLAAHRGVEERGLEGRHRQHRRDAQRRGQSLRTTPHLVSDYGPRRGENTISAGSSSRPGWASRRGFHQRGHPRTEPAAPRRSRRPSPSDRRNRALVLARSPDRSRVLGYRNVYAPILDVARRGRVVECYGKTRS